MLLVPFTILVYYLPALFMGCEVVERHLEMAQPTTKKEQLNESLNN